MTASSRRKPRAGARRRAAVVTANTTATTGSVQRIELIMMPPRESGRACDQGANGVALAGEDPREELVVLEPQRLHAGDEGLEREGQGVADDEHERGEDEPTGPPQRALAASNTTSPSAACMSPNAARRVNETRFEKSRIDRVDELDAGLGHGRRARGRPRARGRARAGRGRSPRRRAAGDARARGARRRRRPRASRPPRKTSQPGDAELGEERRRAARLAASG